jgi:hypothetical protein
MKSLVGYMQVGCRETGVVNAAFPISPAAAAAVSLREAWLGEEVYKCINSFIKCFKIIILELKVFDIALHCVRTLTFGLN